MKRRKDYTAIAVEAAKSVLIELVHLLGEYRDDIVVIGGWVPELLLRERGDPAEAHVGTLDVDLALNHQTLSKSGYRTIQELLISQGYEQRGQQPFIYYRAVKIAGHQVVVQVDLLAGEYGGTGTSRRTQKVQDVRPRKARGCDLAFELNTEVCIEGELPGGGRDTVRVRVASIVPFLVMKGMALHDRLSEKDAWDIYYCLKNFPGGGEALLEECRPHVNQGLVREGFQKIRDKFATIDELGPKLVADFESPTEPAERERLQRDAFERVHYFLDKLGY